MMKTSLFLILMMTFNVARAGQNEFLITPDSRIEITVNTAGAAYGGQSLVLKVISETKTEEFEFQASTGDFESPTKNYQGQISELQSYANSHRHVIFYNDSKAAIQAIDLSRLYKVPSGSLSGEECFNHQLPCTPNGNISLMPDDAGFVYDLLTLIDLKKATIKIINDTNK